MDNQSQKKLEEILAKEVSTLGEQDKVFLRARRSYLTGEQVEKYAKELEIGEPPVGTGKAPEVEKEVKKRTKKK